MTSKADLLSLLKGDAQLEEDIVNKYSTLFQALKFHDDKDRAPIQSGMKILKTDSEKHFKLINEMIKYVEGSKNDGF